MDNLRINVDAIGDLRPELRRTVESESLSHYLLEAELPEAVGQDDWRVQIPIPFTPTFYWASHLTPTDEYVADQHCFRAPAIIVANDDQMLAIIPDLELLKRAKNRWYLDLDAERGVISLGVGNAVVAEHVLYKKAPGNVFQPGVFSFGFRVMESSSADDLANPFRSVAGALWAMEGAQHFAEATRDSLLPYVHHTYRWAFDSWSDAVWQQFELDGEQVGAPAFIVNYSQSPGYPGQPRWREARSVWNQAWFHSLRSAAGLLRFARQTGNEDLENRARLTKELALRTPKNSDGLFYGVVATRMHRDAEGGLQSDGWDSLYWGNSDRNPATRDIEQSPFHILDMSITASQMVKWYQELEQDERLLTYAREYADALLDRQTEDGFFPAWVDHQGQVLGELADSPETSASVVFLLELFEATGDARYREGAERALEAVIRDVVPQGRWEDFETYWSCAPWGVEFLGKQIPRNRMYKKNTLSIGWTAEALAMAYELTGEQRYLELGQRVLDELVMSQAVWQPPYLKAPVFGGFAVMNADGEWLDARQALFAELLAKYAELTGLEEYQERAVAAMGASFAMMYCPQNPDVKALWEGTYPFFSEKDYGFTMENYAHDNIVSESNPGMGEFTIYDWGNGNASAAYLRNMERFPDVFADYAPIRTD